MENINSNHFCCDIYESKLDSDAKIDMTKGFTRFVELYLNRIKRPMSCNKSNQSKPPQRHPSGFREHRANTISVDRSQMVQQKLRNPSGGQGSLVNSFGLGHLSPDSIKGSNCSMDQNQIGSYEAPSLGKYIL